MNKIKNLINITDFTIEEIDSLVQKCEQTEEKVEINKMISDSLIQRIPWRNQS